MLLRMVKRLGVNHGGVSFGGEFGGYLFEVELSFGFWYGA
jgi:hypothetical protein